MSKYGVFSGPYFPVFGLNTEIYGSIQSEYRKIRTRKNSIFGHFSRSDANKSYFAVGTDHTRRVKFRMRLLPSMGLWEIHVVSLDAMSAVYNVNLFVCELPPHVLYRTFCTNMAFLYYGFVLFLV